MCLFEGTTPLGDEIARTSRQIALTGTQIMMTDMSTHGNAPPSCLLEKAEIRSAPTIMIAAKTAENFNSFFAKLYIVINPRINLNVELRGGALLRRPSRRAG